VLFDIISTSLMINLMEFGTQLLVSAYTCVVHTVTVIILFLSSDKHDLRFFTVNYTEELPNNKVGTDIPEGDSIIYY
jgi:hypothetical protein